MRSDIHITVNLREGESRERGESLRGANAPRRRLRINLPLARTLLFFLPSLFPTPLSLSRSLAFFAKATEKTPSICSFVNDVSRPLPPRTLRHTRVTARVSGTEEPRHRHGYVQLNRRKNMRVVANFGDTLYRTRVTFARAVALYVLSKFACSFFASAPEDGDVKRPIYHAFDGLF